jgi:arylsulfatase A-like enzyme
MSDAFGGTIKREVKDSTPWWPKPNLPAPELPNIVTILLDDTGFAHLGCFGSPIETPHFDSLAERGLRYNNFHTTALCSPSRACLLTGRNHHSVGMRAVSNFDTGFPNMRGRISASAATTAELLQQKGWATFCVGKWHLAPMREASAAGPFTDWPLQRGFDRFYGFMQGETDQFHPELYADNHMIEPPSRPEDGYHLSEDLVDQAIKMIRNQVSLVPERPFYLYLPFGATHAPHQAPDAYLDKYKGRFDEGWDIWRSRIHQRQLELGIIPEGTKLAPRNPGVKPWADLDSTEQAFALKLQEAFAAFLDHTDAQVGRLLEALKALSLTDNTLIFATSDNGASQEGNETGVLDEFRHFNGLPEDMGSVPNRLNDIGTRRSFTNYPWGWAQVGNTPAKRYKQNTHGGGVRDPLIISWPRGTDPSTHGEVRQQFHHITDIMPTIMDICGYDLPAEMKGVVQQPIEGLSMRYTLAPEAVDAQAVPTQKPAQYFEMFGHRGIWANGWKAVTYHRANRSLDEDQWELYHLDEDFSECHNLAESRPEKLGQMIELFWREAERYGVLPIETNQNTGLFAGRPQPGTPRSRDHFTYFPPLSRVPTDSTPPFGARSWRLEARLRCKTPPEGVLIAVGTVNNGLCIYFENGTLVYDHNAFTSHTVIRATMPVPLGDVSVTVEQVRVSKGPARVRLIMGDNLVGEGMIPDVPVMISSIGMDVGSNPTGVSEAFEAPFPFNGVIQRIDVTTERAMRPDAELAIELEQALRTQ